MCIFVFVFVAIIVNIKNESVREGVSLTSLPAK